MAKLLDYQQPHVDALAKALKTYGTAKDGSDTGTGKTPCAAELCRRFGVQPFVVCPKRLRSSWARWLNEWDVTPVDIINYEKLRYGNTPFVSKKLIRNRPSFTFNTELLKGKLVIWDEDHYLKAVDSQNALLCKAATRAKLNQLFIGATPFTTAMDMRAVGYALGLHQWSDFYKWIRTYGCFKHPAFGHWVASAKREHLEKLHGLLYPDHGSRMRVADIQEHFPFNHVSADVYDIDSAPKIQAVYDAIAELNLERENDEANPMVDLLRERQEIEYLKAHLLRDLARDHLASGYSVVVFVSFKRTLDILISELSAHNPAVIRGGMSDKAFSAERERFQENQTDVCLCMIQAGGAGLDFHDLYGKPRVSLICPSFNPREFLQALGRIHRAGARSDAIQKVVFASGTVEEKVCASVRRKLDNISLINDADLNPLF